MLAQRRDDRRLGRKPQRLRLSIATTKTPARLGDADEVTTIEVLTHARQHLEWEVQEGRLSGRDSSHDSAAGGWRNPLLWRRQRGTIFFTSELLTESRLGGTQDSGSPRHSHRARSATTRLPAGRMRAALQQTKAGEREVDGPPGRAIEAT
jgi:hypothetical protein